MAENKKAADRKSYVNVPYESADSGETFNRFQHVNEELISKLAQTTLINPIVQARIYQMEEYLNPLRGADGKGFVIEKNVGRFQNSSLSKQEEIEVESIIKFLMNGGDNDNPQACYDDISTFNSQFLYQSLTLDAASAELVYTRGGDLSHFVHVDAATIRRTVCYDQKNHLEGFVQNSKGYYPTFAQILGGVSHQVFYPDELYYMVRNPDPAVNRHKYGMPEIIKLGQTIGDYVAANKYNSKKFSSVMAKGFLIGKNLEAGADQQNSIMEQINRIASGVEKSHRILALSGDDFQWVDLEKKQDMDHEKYIAHLFKIACAIYRITPEEVNFPLEGQRAALGGGGKEEQYSYSERMGLFPLIRKTEKLYNRIVNILSEGKYRFRFIYDEENKDAQLERMMKEVKSHKFVNEVRAELGLPPDPSGDIILDNNWMQNHLGSLKQEAQQEVDRQEEEAVKSAISDPESHFNQVVSDTLGKMFSDEDF